MPEYLQKGYKLKGQYIIDDCLYCDNTGAIYQITDQRGIKRAIKEIIPDAPFSENVKEQFIQRLERIKKIYHTNLIKIDDYFIDNYRYYIVMHLLKGKNLEETFKEKSREGSESVKFSLNCMVKVCSVLKYLHTQKPYPIPLGSLKPSTIFITSNGQIKLTNYGVSNIVLTVANRGKPGFHAPEQYRDGILNTKTDIFSLGASIYYVLTGENPEESPMKFKNIRLVNPEIPESLNQIVLSCLKELPKDRPRIEQIAPVLVKAYLGSTMPVTPPRSISAPMTTKLPGKPGGPEPKLLRTVTKNMPPELAASFRKFAVNQNESIDEGDSSGEKMLSSYDNFDEPGRKILIDLELDELDNLNINGLLSDIDDVLEKPESKYISEREEFPPGEIYEEQPIKETPLTGESVIEEDKTEKELISPEEDKEKKIKAPKTKPLPKLQRSSSVILEQKFEPVLVEQKFEPAPVEQKFEPESITGKQIPDLSSETQKELETTEPSMDDKYKTSTKQYISQYESDQSKRVPSVDFRRIKDTSSISAFLKAKSMEESGQVVKEEKVPAPIYSVDMDFSDVASYRDPEAPPEMELYEEIDILKDRYEIAEILKQNYFGATYLIRDYDEEDEDKEVKILKEIQYKEPDGNIEKVREIAVKFMEEANILQKCEHVNLIKVLDYFHIIEEEKCGIRLFLVYEYLSGLTFEEVLEMYKASAPHMSAMTLFGLITKICNAVSYLHEGHKKPVFVGEFKPDDLILAPDGEIKILNFGLFNIFEGVRPEFNPLRGTTGFGAPEMIKNGELNEKTDVFSLAVLMYFMLTSKNLTEKPYDFPPIRKLNPYLSNKVERFISLCLSFTPSQRPTMIQIKRAIDSIDFFETTVRTASAEESEEEKSSKTQKLPKKKKDTLKDEKKKPSIFKNRIFQTVFALIVLIIIIYGAGKFGKHIIPEKEKFPGLLYAKNSRELSIIDMKEGKTVSDVELKKSLVAVVYSNKTGCLYGVNLTDEKLIELKPGSEKILRDCPLGREPSSITLSLEQDRAYITNSRANTVTVVDLSTFQNIVSPLPVGAGPSSSVLSHDGKTLCVINKFQATITFINTESNTVIDTIDVEKDPRSAAFNSDNNKLYITHPSLDKITILDIKTKELLNSITVKSGPVDIISEKSSPMIYIILQKTQEIIILSTTDDTILARYPLGFYPLKVQENLDNKELFISGQSLSGTGYNLYKFNTLNNTTTSITKLERAPLFILPVYY